MHISTSLFFDRSSKQLGTLATRNQTLQTQIATGKRLAVPSDDAVAYRRLQTIAQATADGSAWESNIALARTVLEQADTALGSVTSRLQRAQELTLQAANGTLSAADHRTIAIELRGIVDDLVALANSKDARGGPLFGSATGDTALTRDPAGVVSFTGTGNPPGIPIGQDVTIQPSESAGQIFGNIPNGAGTTDSFALLASFVTALESGGNPAAAAATTVQGLKVTLDQVGAARGSVGARGIRLDLESTRLEDAATVREGERSFLEDIDVTKAIIELQKTSTILQATQASLSRLSQLSLFDYIR
jgi:flagellar hook-associated protein 3 FlgL